MHRSVPFYFNWTPSRGCYGTPIGGKKVNIEIFSLDYKHKIEIEFSFTNDNTNWKEILMAPHEESYSILSLEGYRLMSNFFCGLSIQN